MSKPPFSKPAHGTFALAVLLLIAACSAEASAHRANVILVADDAAGLAPIVRRFRAAGYSTALAGQFAHRPEAAGFGTHCIWHPDRTPRQWGPTVLLDGQMATFPDDIRAAELFAEQLAQFARDTDNRPFFACYSLGPTFQPAAAKAPARAAVERLLRAFASADLAHGSTVLLAVSPAPGAEPESALRLLIAWPDDNPENHRIVERGATRSDLSATLRELATLPAAAPCATSFARELTRDSMRPAVPR